MSQKRILLVDDEPNIRVLLGSILQQAGYVVDVAEDGYSALRKIQHGFPDLIVTDLRMPNMNGFELLSVIRTRFPQLPTVAISGEFVSVHEEPLADAFFQKGHYEVQEFLATIIRLLSAPRKGQPKSKSSPMWTPIKDAPVMLTCTECLRSFPIEPCENVETWEQIDCIFCGAHLNVQLVAIGVAQSGSD
jgi:CheY-like chemotaxis protein